MFNTTASAGTNDDEQPFLKFPPFPAPPPGRRIEPFKGFKGYGIQKLCKNGVEVDGVGIPTVELPNKHSTDQCKTDATRKKKPKKVDARPKKEWWEIWEECEHARAACTYNLCVIYIRARFDRCR